jgi:hypothetical protein
MVKNEDEEGEKVEIFWVAVEVLRLIALRGKMELEFAKDAKIKGKFCHHRCLFLFFQF